MTSDRDAQLKAIADMLGDGLVTQVEPFPETDKEFANILQELRKLDPDDLEGKLVIGGFLDHPYGPDKHRCLECRYYLVPRTWCDLPELAVPVGPGWGGRGVRSWGERRCSSRRRPGARVSSRGAGRVCGSA